MNPIRHDQPTHRGSPSFADAPRCTSRALREQRPCFLHRRSRLYQTVRCLVRGASAARPCRHPCHRRLRQRARSCLASESAEPGESSNREPRSLLGLPPATQVDSLFFVEPIPDERAVRSHDQLSLSLVAEELQGLHQLSDHRDVYVEIGLVQEQDTSGTQECGCETDHKEYLLLARRQLLNRVLKRRPSSGFALHNETPVLPKTCYTLTSMRQSEVRIRNLLTVALGLFGARFGW